MDEPTVVKEEEEDVVTEQPKRLRENLYDRIKIPIKTMDIFIGIVGAVLVVLIIYILAQAIM